MLETIIAVEIALLIFIMQQTKLKVLDLFSGIGNFSLKGLCKQSLGQFETIAFCEKDKFCQRYYKKIFQT